MMVNLTSATQARLRFLVDDAQISFKTISDIAGVSPSTIKDVYWGVKQPSERTSLLILAADISQVATIRALVDGYVLGRIDAGDSVPTIAKFFGVGNLLITRVRDGDVCTTENVRRLAEKVRADGGGASPKLIREEMEFFLGFGMSRDKATKAIAAAYGLPPKTVSGYTLSLGDGA